MKIRETPIKDLLILEPEVFSDSRGYFFESFRDSFFVENLTGYSFVQDNQAGSVHGVIRGLHYQRAPFAQAKLVRVLDGEILDVVVDIRKNSPTFGKCFSVKLSALNRLQLLIPEGFAHGYSVTGENAVVFYKCNKYYSPEHEGGISWNDTDLAIDWQIPADKAIVSQKDLNWPALATAKL
jgi:dTDP-4-dehydrorhamnose 3,5-epimerase